MDRESQRTGIRGFSVRIKPAIRAAEPLTTQVGMKKIDACIHIRHHRPGAGVADAPESGGIDRSDIPLERWRRSREIATAGGAGAGIRESNSMLSIPGKPTSSPITAAGTVTAIEFVIQKGIIRFAPLLWRNPFKNPCVRSALSLNSLTNLSLLCALSLAFIWLRSTLSARLMITAISLSGETV